ncbi:MAG: tetratricopeptide repeat protein [Magnetococcales bacterium]|nr:tetratricopeptide repeat protein [Magnetococcales bacterium]
MSDQTISRNDKFADDSGGVVASDWWSRLETLLERKTGLKLTYSRPTVLNLLQDRRVALGLSNLEDYLSLLSDPGKGQREWSDFLLGLTVHESYFFRDPDQLSVIENYLLPELLSKQGGDCALNLWSAGCASGEEAYTLAMILRNLILRNFFSDQLGVLRQVKILGTDIAPDCIRRARRGCYPSWSFRCIPRDIWETCFYKEEDGSYRIDPHLADGVGFMELNLMEAANVLGWQPRFDLVVCRNVFIYLSSQAIRRILEAMFALLKPGGYLITGHGETERQFMEKSGYVVRTFSHSQVFQKPEVQAKVRLSVPMRPVTVPKNHPRRTPENRETTPEEICDRMRHRIAEGDHSRAQAEGDAAMAVYPDNAPIQTLLAWALANLGRLSQAEEACLAAIRMDPSASAPHGLLGQVLSDSQRFDEAIRHFQIAIYLDPGDVLAMIELGNLLAQLGRRQEACREWQSALHQLLREPEDRSIGFLERWSVKTLVDELQRILQESC